MHGHGECIWPALVDEVKRRPGRPRTERGGDAPRVTIRVSERELVVLREAADADQRTTADYVRAAALREALRR